MKIKSTTLNIGRCNEHYKPTYIITVTVFQPIAPAFTITMFITYNTKLSPYTFFPPNTSTFSHFECLTERLKKPLFQLLRILSFI